MPDALIFDAVRTPRGRGKPGGPLGDVAPVDLAAQVLDSLTARNGGAPDLVEDVVLGCVEPVGDQGGDVARAAVLRSGLSSSVAGMQINRFCGSGLEACNLVAAKVAAGATELAVGGGVEMMSKVPMGSSGYPMATDPRLAMPNYFIPQGVAADLIATRHGYSRDALDAYAVTSQQRAKEAWDRGRFERSVIPVKDGNGLTLLERDEALRPEVTMQSLGALEPSFEKMAKAAGFDGVAVARYPEIEAVEYRHHAGNSSGIVDGAAGVLIGSAAGGNRLGVKPRARIRSMAAVGSEPTIMLTGPLPATELALARAGMTKADIDLWEINEAFASVVLLYQDALDLPWDRLNVNGGAIAMGHPLGATGAMLLGTVLDELERQDLATGLVTLCVAGGMGVATIIERV